MMLALKLILAHIIGDFTLQKSSWVKHKEVKKIRSSKLYFHIGIHFLLLLFFLNFDIPKYWLGILTITISHFIIDVLKLYFKNDKNERYLFFIDQILHLLVIGFVVNYYESLEINLSTIFNEKVLLFFTCILLITNVSSIIIKVFINRWKPEEQEENDTSLAKAGSYIGVLERLFVFSFIVLNHWEAIGFLLAAKSVFRFGDLKDSKDRKLTEYILIGTLLSFGLAILIGIFYLYVSNFLQ